MFFAIYKENIFLRPTLFKDVFGSNPPARSVVEVSRLPKDVNVEMLLGISQDEVYRVKTSRYHYVTHEYPLIDKRLSRKN